MSAAPLGILGTGMLTAVGFSSAASCAAIRADIANFTETRFIDGSGEWIVGSAVPFDEPLRGGEMLLRLLADAIGDCLDGAADLSLADTPVLLCTAESNRPGVVEGDAQELFNEVQEELGVRFHHESRIFAEGRVGGARALAHARQLVYVRNQPRVLVAGVDSCLTAEALRSFEDRRRLLTATNSDGFAPGEAGAAVLVGRPAPRGTGGFACLGLGFGHEEASVESEKPLRADGLVQAINAAFADAGLSMDDMDFRMTDDSGEQYYFKEGTLAVSRTFGELKAEFDIWHPADCIGEVAAATLPCLLGVARAATEGGYAPGKTILCHLGNDDGARAALVLRSTVGDA